MTEMRVYHETFEDVSYVALVVGREHRLGRFEPWDTDEMAVREKLDTLKLTTRFNGRRLYHGLDIMGVIEDIRWYFTRRKTFSDQYLVYSANGKLEGTIDELRKLKKDQSMNLEISEGLPELVSKKLSLELK